MRHVFHRLQKLYFCGYDVHGVEDFMGDTGGQLTDRGELLCLKQVISGRLQVMFRLLPRCDVPADAHDPRGFAVFIPDKRSGGLLPVGASVFVIQFYFDDSFAIEINRSFAKFPFYLLAKNSFHHVIGFRRDQFFNGDLHDLFGGVTRRVYFGRAQVGEMQVHVHGPDAVVHVFDNHAVLLFTFLEGAFHHFTLGDVSGNTPEPNRLSRGVLHQRYRYFIVAGAAVFLN